MIDEYGKLAHTHFFVLKGIRDSVHYTFTYLFAIMEQLDK